MSDAGRFIWFELSTTDVEAAKSFYGEVVGWTTQPQELYGAYTMWQAPRGPIGGVMLLTDAAKAKGVPPHWTGYVRVANAKQTATRAAGKGGTVLMPATAMPDGSTVAVLADPQGAVFAVHQSAHPEQEEAAKPGLGEFSWAELLTTDPDAGFAFYADLFGWQTTGKMAMGAAGDYHMFGRIEDARSMGGVMRCPAGLPRAAWLHYVNVVNADDAVAKATARGAQLLHGPVDVAGGGRIASLLDPQGVAFAVYAET